MGFDKGFNTQILLENKLSKMDVKNCFEDFFENHFQAYDYEKNIYSDVKEILEKYPARSRYSLRYKKCDFVLTCNEGKSYLLLLVDRHTDGSELIQKLTNTYVGLLTQTLFSYIDDEGDSPKNLETVVNNTDIKWLFKYNYFGKYYLEKYSKDFFTNMPCVNQEFITDDIIRIDLVKDIFDKTDEKLKTDINDYLEKHSIKIRFYDYRQHYID